MSVNPKLKLAFRFNALFSASCATVLLLTANWWANQFGLDEVIWIYLAALGLLLFASYLVWLSTTQRQPKEAVVSIIISDWAYVFAALLGVVIGWTVISAMGVGFLVITSVVVAIAAEWQRRAAFNLSITNKISKNS